jgi:hypothetical protein
MNHRLWVYSQITPKVFENLRALGKQKGIKLSHAPTGYFSFPIGTSRIDLSYRWDVLNRQLFLKCESKPLLVSHAMIKSFADQMILQCGGTIV